MSKFNHTNLLVGASLGAMLCSTVSLFAQEAASTQKTENEWAIDTIVVTAQRRSQDKQDVPITVTVLGGDYIEKARIESIQDIAIRTPGFGYDVYPASEPRLSVRGVASSARGAGGDPSVAVFIDEIYYGRPASINFEAFDVQRIEVLKGPQGTLFGRNVAGGAVSVTTRPADLGGFDAALEVTYGSHDRMDMAGFVNIPLIEDKVAFRATGVLRRHDGYVTRIVDGVEEGELDNKDSKSARFQLYAEPTESFRLDIKADFTIDRANGPGNRVLSDTGSGGLSGAFASGTVRGENASTFDGQQDRDIWGIVGKAELDLSFASVSYLGSYRELDYVSYYDFDGSEPHILDINGGNSEESDFYSHEIQLRALPDSDLNWVVGLYQYKADIFRDSPTDLLAGGSPYVTDYLVQDAEIESVAVYADATIPLTDEINVFGGIRYTEDKKSVFSSGETNAPGTFFTIGDNGTGAYAANASATWDAITWRIGTDWHIAEDHMVYVSISRGFKSGGFQDTPVDSLDAETSFNPEFVLNYEIGHRSKFLDGNMIFNNSVYFTDYSDLQTRIRTGIGFRAINASAEIYGLESELNWKIGNGFTVGAGYAYVHGRYTDFEAFQEGEAVNFAGNRLTRIPDHKFILSLAYEVVFESGASLELSTDYSYDSVIYDDHDNQPPAIRSATHFIDARAVYSFPDDHWTLSVWGKNITNERTEQYNALFGGVQFVAFNPPTTFGATLRWNY
ncbi:MAG: TonB-dependent receptor [Emcibacter sp.]|nr:TonB-dependent receptor [Emcibacter sp.]